MKVMVVKIEHAQNNLSSERKKPNLTTKMNQLRGGRGCGVGGEGRGRSCVHKRNESNPKPTTKGINWQPIHTISINEANPMNIKNFW
jgi:hypothetical protein